MGADVGSFTEITVVNDQNWYKVEYLACDRLDSRVGGRLTDRVLIRARTLVWRRVCRRIQGRMRGLVQLLTQRGLT